jgi:DNA-directed RNA polymerase subunit M/transcription elongation factor TFIIS
MYRGNGIKVLGRLIKSESNCSKLENKVHSLSTTQEDYNLLIQEIVNDRRMGMSCRDIMNELRGGKYLEGSDEYNKYKERVDEHDRFLVKPFEVEEGVLECGKCNSNKTISYAKQTRSGDESTTVFATCYNCNNVWKI